MKRLHFRCLEVMAAGIIDNEAVKLGTAPVHFSATGSPFDVTAPSVAGAGESPRGLPRSFRCPVCGASHTHVQVAMCALPLMT